MPTTPHLRVTIELDPMAVADAVDRRASERKRVHRPLGEVFDNTILLGGVHKASSAKRANDGQIALPADFVLLTVMLESGCEPPMGHVIHGAAQGRFTNRVELLHALDAAQGEASW